jgi:hypothetical protein
MAIINDDGRNPVAALTMERAAILSPASLKWSNRQHAATTPSKRRYFGSCIQGACTY